MKIKSRLKLNTWFSLGAIAIMLVTLGWSIREVNRTDRNVLLVDNMRKAAYERIYLRDDFLLNPNEKAKAAWYVQSETLRAMLEKADERFSGPQDRALLKEVRENFEATYSAFTEILEKPQPKAPPGGRKTYFDDAGSPLTSVVFKSAYALNDGIVRLHESARGASTAVRNKVTLLIILFVVGIGIVIVINSIYISRIVTKRVAALDDGIERIGDGDLDIRIDEMGHDELSDLAHASNEMIAKLRESQTYVESLIDTVREPLIALDQDLRVVTVSRAFYDFFKVKPEETVGQLIYDLGNKQWDIPKLRELLETILPEKSAFENYEVEHDFAGVGRRIMLLNARQIQRALGKERIILLAIEDITERKAVEVGLEKTRQELAVIKIAADEVSEYAESIINTVREPLISLDQDLRVVKASHSFYDVFKVNPEETIGQLIYNLGNKQWDIPKLRELLETILPQKAAFDNYEVEHDFAGVGRRIMLLNARQIQRVWGKERIILLAIEDITERKAIEAGLETTRRELAVIKVAADEVSEYAESLINTVREPLIALDQDLRVVTVSRSFYDFFKVKPEETVGQLIYDLGNKQWDIPKLRELLETILPQKAAFDNYEVEHDFTGVGRRIMLLNARQIQRVWGKERIILLAIEDITERKAIEAGLETTRKELEAANKELEAFTYSVSHDLRAPLRGVLGFSRILVDEYAAQLPPEVQRYLGLVHSNTQQMGRLVDDLLSFSRFSRQAMAATLIDPATLVREAFDMLSSGQPERSVKMTIGDLTACRGDRGLLKQVFVNLISNALKFTRQRDPAIIEVGSRRMDGQTVYFVRDNGAGFDMRYVGKLFGVFQRLHSAETYEGTGVGLAIVQRIVHRHGGRIWAEGEIDKGATFFFTLGGIPS
jgi:PAS domain S-box-containing protein